MGFYLKFVPVNNCFAQSIEYHHRKHMDVEKLNDELVQLVEKKIVLAGIDYNDEKYDDVENEVHDLEDTLVQNFGQDLEEALHLVHDEYCPDDDVLSPIAYLANFYVVTEGEGGAKSYSVKYGQGVLVEADDFPGKAARLVLLPSPPRIVLQLDKKHTEVVWTAS